MLVVTELRLAWRTPSYLIAALGLPVLLLVIFGSIPSLTRPSKDYDGVSFFTIYTPTLMVLVLIFLGLLNLPSKMAGYREQGVLHRMSTTPVPAYALLGAQVAINVMFALVSIALLLGVGAGAFNLVLPVQFGWFVLSLALTVAAMFGIGLCIAAFASTARVALVVGGLLFYPLAFFSGMYGPLTVYPGVVGQIAKWAPTGAGFDAVHAALGGHFPGWTGLGVLAVYASLFSTIAVRWFRWDIERSHIGRGRILALLTFTRRVTLAGDLTGDEVARSLREGLASRFEVEPSTKFKGRLLGAARSQQDLTSWWSRREQPVLGGPRLGSCAHRAAHKCGSDRAVKCSTARWVWPGRSDAFYVTLVRPSRQRQPSPRAPGTAKRNKRPPDAVCRAHGHAEATFAAASGLAPSCELAWRYWVSGAGPLPGGSTRAGWLRPGTPGARPSWP